MNNLQRKFKFYKMLREAAKGKINEFYYENPEGKSYSDYEMWQLAVTSKYPQAIIQPELDTDAAVERGEAVGFWDHQTQHGIVYDPNLIKKENMDMDSFQATDFTPEELEIIKTIMPEAIVDESGLVTFGTFALLKFKSGIIELVMKEGGEYKDFKSFNDITDLQQNLKESIPSEKPLYENFQNDDFNIEGFKENMKAYVNNVENYIDFDDQLNIYYVNIPFTALKTDDVSVANKIVRISEKYPRCIASSVDWEKKEIRFVFSNRPVVKESLYRKSVLKILKEKTMYDNTVLPLGLLNLVSGDTKYFNVHEAAGIEIWETDSGIFKAVVTVEKNPHHKIHEHVHFNHDQSYRPLFNGKLVNYSDVNLMHKMIPLYGKSIMCYIYK